MDRLSSQSSQSFAKLTTALDESADDCKKYFHINIKKKKKKKKKKKMLPAWRRSNPQASDHQPDAHPNEKPRAGED